MQKIRKLRQHLIRKNRIRGSYFTVLMKVENLYIRMSMLTDKKMLTNIRKL